MLKKFICLICSLLLIGGVTCYAYVLPDNYYFVSGTLNGGGSITFYLPVNAEGCMALQDSTPINQCSSTVYGYITYNNTDYRITFPTYEYGYFGSQYNQDYITLRLSNITDTNFDFLTDTDYFTYPDLEVILISGIAIIGGLLWLQYMMKSRH